MLVCLYMNYFLHLTFILLINGMCLNSFRKKKITDPKFKDKIIIHIEFLLHGIM